MKGIISISCLLLLMSSWAIAQDEEVVQVITKRITKTFPYSAGVEVNLEGQNAEVFVESWDKEYINVKIELISEHPQLKVAEQDIERMNYLATRVKRNVYLRNYVANKEVPTNAVLKAKYFIQVPEACPVYLKNQFGSTNVKDLANRLRIFSEFSNIQLENINGQVEMRTKFGDVYAYRLAGNYTINARRSNLNLHEVVGSYNITSSYGMLNLFAGQGLIDLNIDAQKTDVNLFNIDPLTHQHQLTVKYGDVIVPNGWKFRFEEKTPDIKRVVFKPAQEFYANITISVAFGDLKIEGKK